MRDLTLVILTHNRARLLAALLSYLETEKADCHVLALDSSHPKVRGVNRARVACSSLDIQLAELEHAEPGQKRRQAIHKVTTPFCALCADSDLFMLEGMRHCLDALRGNPEATMAGGYSFTFLPRADGDMELIDIVHSRPTIEDPSPLGRIGKLYEQYPTPSSGVFRTTALRRIFDAAQPLTKTLSHDLLWWTLTVIEGQPIHLPDFSYGRGMCRSDKYDPWHPLEWFCKDPDSLFAEYLRYRELLAAALMRRPDNELQPGEIRDLIDLIHLRYLTQHAPDSVLEFVAEQQIAGVDFSDNWPRHGTFLPLYAAAGKSARSERPTNIRSRERCYLLFPNFYAPRGGESPQLDNVIRLIGSLDSYRPAIDSDFSCQRHDLTT
jgi:glycosyltransferase domain-containing protein